MHHKIEKGKAIVEHKLSRSLGLFDVTVAGVGIILGAGIYALLGVAAQSAGNATWLSFLISAVVAIFTGLSYAELSSKFRGDAGEYDYIKNTLGSRTAFLIGMSIIFAGIISGAAVSLGFAGYFVAFLNMPIIIAAILITVIMALINYSGIKNSAWFNRISTFVEFAGLLFIIILGIKYFGKTEIDYMYSPLGFGGIFSSAALVFFAYMGFESIIKLSEETKRPEKTIPKALIYSIIITTILYVLVAVSAVTIIGWEQLASSKAPMALIASFVLGSKANIVMTIIALFSTSNTILLTMIATSRQTYGMAKENSLPKFLAAVHGSTRTPWLAILLVTIIAILFIVIGDIGFVANLTNVFLFITFAAVNLGLIILRFKSSAKMPVKTSFRCPLNIGRFPVIALLGFFTSLGLMVFAIINLF